MLVRKMIGNDLKCVRAESTVNTLKETESMAVDEMAIEIVLRRFTATLCAFANFDVCVLLQVQEKVAENEELW